MQVLLNPVLSNKEGAKFMIVMCDCYGYCYHRLDLISLASGNFLNAKLEIQESIFFSSATNVNWQSLTSNEDCNSMEAPQVFVMADDFVFTRWV